MKKLKILLLATALVFSGTLFANNDNKENEAAYLAVSEEIGELLDNPGFDVDDEINAVVTIAVNNDRQMVVLRVDCESKQICSYIKSRLNYKTLPKDIAFNEKKFKVPVKVTPEK
jgi:hypothetical protein